VSDSLTGLPIDSAKIVFGSDTVYSNYSGVYLILNPDLISAYITCSKSGYQTSQTAIESPSSGTVTVNFRLVPLYTSCSEANFEFAGRKGGASPA
jgi:hypothetical protein